MTIHNLLPIALCNSSMGSLNMWDFKRDYKDDTRKR